MKDALGAVQRVAVLGGTSEIGLAVVRALAAERPGSLDVVLAGRDADAMAAAGAALVQAGAKEVTTVPFDAADTASHHKVVDELFARGDVDVVVMAFGVLGDQDRFDRDPVAAADAAAVNYVAGVSTGLAVAEHLRRQGHGTLVVLSSVAGERVRKANFVYGSTKAGLDGFAQGLGDRLHGSGASVLIVRPGFVRTRMTAGMKAAPLSTTAEGVAADVVRGLRRGREVVWSPAPLRWLFMVLRHVPRAVFRKLPL